MKSIPRTSRQFNIGSIAYYVDLHVIARLVSARVNDTPADLDEILESLGIEMSWSDKMALLQQLDGVEAVYHAVRGKILVRRVVRGGASSGAEAAGASALPRQA